MWKPYCSKQSWFNQQTLASQLTWMLLLPDFTTPYLGNSELEDKYEYTVQFSKAGASLQSTTYLEHGLRTLAHGSCCHSCSVGTPGKQLRPMGSSGLCRCITLLARSLLGLGRPSLASQSNAAGERLVDGARLPGKDDIPNSEDMMALSCWFQRTCLNEPRQMSH